MFIWICVSLLPRIIHFTSQRCQQKSPFVAYVSLYCYRDILTNRAQLSDMVNSTLRVLREALRFLLSTVCGIIRTYAVVTEQTLCSDAVTPGWFVIHKICNLSGQDLRFSRRWCRRSESSGMWHRVVGRLVPDVSTWHYISGDLTLNLTGW
jgi:hypothetical protein